MIFWIPAIVLFLALLLALTLASARRIEEARSVILHLPCEAAWEAIRDFPALHAAHTRGRPDLVIEETVLRAGSGREPGSIWRQRGWWRGGSYWADLQVTAWDPPRRLAVSLVRDSLATQHGLLSHRGEITLVPEGPAVTKLTWRLRARFGGVRLPLAQRLWPERMRARLIDIGLRSVKRAIERDARREGRPAGEAAAPEVFSAPAFGPGGRLHDQA